MFGKVKVGALFALAILIFVMGSGCSSQEKAKADLNIPSANMTLKSQCDIISPSSGSVVGYVLIYDDLDNNNTVYITIGPYNLVSGVSAVKN